MEDIDEAIVLPKHQLGNNEFWHPSLSKFCLKEKLVEDETLINKFGLKKKIVQVGQGWEVPELGDEITVNYTGSVVNGARFASSTEKGEPLVAIIGKDPILKGCQDGLITMRKGEISIFIVPPTLTQGTHSLFPGVPLDATLEFHVELISWFKVVDICKDGGIIKKILLKSEELELPQKKDEVTVKYEVKLEDGSLVAKSPDNGVEFIVNDGHLCPAFEKTVYTMRKGEQASLRVQPKFRYIGKLSDGTIFDTKGYDSTGPFEFKVDEEQVIEGLDRAVATMKRREAAIVIISHEYGFGDSKTEAKSTVIPARSTLYYEVEMLGFTKVKESWDMEADEKLEYAAKRKEEGNSYFKAGKYSRAGLRYDMAAKYVEFDSTFSAEQKKLGKFFTVTCNLNHALCQLKLKEFTEAAKLCTKVLKLDPCNVKALYRRAHSYLELIDLDQAELDLKKALAIDSNNGEVLQLLQRVKNTQSYYDKKEKTLFSDMVSKLKI
ncbi:hypothetical protein IFM89_018282 [Coptis chinensis]|uniref:peptidylprolyl isomerase n=1 Tax=Coptis chinensis TaxID=261450 RepID=A0A835IEN5_9MAGN|nr:hypothetical protein IFM89_018282 [Coptis chinensis]